VGDLHGLEVLLESPVLLHQTQHQAVVLLQVAGDAGEPPLVFGHLVQQAAIGQAGVGDLVVLGGHHLVVDHVAYRGEYDPRTEPQKPGEKANLDRRQKANKGNPPPRTQNHVAFRKQAVENATRDFLAMKVPPTAIFACCETSQVAIHAWRLTCG